MAASLKDRASSLAEQYRNELLNNSVAFWEKYSLDAEHGGYFTCLNEDGSVFDTDKFVWLQARQVWLFSKLYNTLPVDTPGVGQERRAKWLSIAESGAKFLEKHGRNSEGHFYFSLTRDGRPIMQPHSIFSDCFAAMAFAQYSKAADASWAQELAVKTFDNIERRKANPKGAYNKAYPGTRSFRSLAVPMIDINLCLEIAEVIQLDITERVTKNISQIFDVFLDKDNGLLRENVANNAADQDTFEGRLLNPGHAIEACWFLMDVARKRNIPNVVDRAGEILLRTIATLEYGWDKQHGGKPPQQLEWDQKLWWVHVETLVGLSLGYLLSDDANNKKGYEEWYTKVHEWTWARFPDKKHGEWYGYLNRRGEVLLPLKGGKWKGCFHIPRSMLLCWQNFAAIAKK